MKQEIFNHFSETFGVTLTEQEWFDILHLVRKHNEMRHAFPEDYTFEDGKCEALDFLMRYTTIELEYMAAVKKHPDFPEDMFRQLAIVHEELGEVAKAVLHYHYECGSFLNIRKELMQTAAMCVRMLENLKEKPNEKNQNIGNSDNDQ